MAMEDVLERFEIVGDDEKQGIRIKVVGVGGAGGNALNNMVEHGVTGVEFIAINTDMQALRRCKSGIKTLPIGSKTTGGLGAGNNPAKGKEAAEESESDIIDMLSDANMVFITAGMGGGTGTGASPVIAGIAKEMGILTVAVVTKPFSWEMKIRHRNAEKGIEELMECVDALIVVQNDRVLTERVPLIEAFKRVDDVLRQGVQGITDIINVTGYVNADFNDVKNVLSNRGMALMAIAEAEGEQRCEEVVRKALSNPLIECEGIKGAKGILYNVTSGVDFYTDEFDRIGKLIQEEVGEDADFTYGWVLDESMEGKIKLTIIAAGFSNGRVVSAKVAEDDMEIKKQLLEESISAMSYRGGISIKEVETEVSINDTVPGFLKRFLTED